MDWDDDWWAKPSLKLNAWRGGKPHFTLCAQAWENRLNGCWHSHRFVSIIDHIFIFLSRPCHCRNSWLKRKDNV